MLDIDDPDEVIRAAGKFTTALTTTKDHVVGTVADGFTLPRGPRAEFDCRGEEVNKWICTTIVNAALKLGDQAEKPSHATRVGVTALNDVDIDGGSTISNASV
ncbi:hypothetical protein [Nocardia brevicatena]|uniref:hypothetical protein n=1 Tax=Nocardia brevicatena TaxID=37327 RepID=UPI0002D7264F|nr:hypothetical protein [Nocardia brevicatena]